MARFSFVKFHQSAGARRGVQTVMGVIAAIFIVGAFFQFGGSRGGGPKEREQKTAFAVNGRAVPMQQFLYQVKNTQEQMQMYGAGTGPTSARELKLSVLDNMTESIATMQDAEKLGIKASPDDIRQAREEWIQNRLGSIGTGAARAKALTDMNKTEEEFAQDVEQDAAQMRERFQEGVIRDKHKEAVTADVTITDEQFEQMFTKLELRDIVVKVDEKAQAAAEPASGAEAAEGAAEEPPATEAAGEAKSEPEGQTDKEPKGHPEAEAKELIDKVYEKVKAGDDFEKLAKEFTEDKFAAEQAGKMQLSRGDFHREQLGEDFFDVAYALNDGEVGEPVRAKDGFHILKLIKTETTKPKDFDEKKDELREQKLSQEKDARYREYCDQLRKSAQVTVEDEELRAYKLAEDGKNEEALALLIELAAEEERAAAEARETRRALAKGDEKEPDSEEEESPVSAEIWYETARLSQLLGNREEAEAKFLKAIKAQDGPDLRVEFGKFLKDQGRTDDAVVELQAASKMAYSDQMVHYQIKGLFEEMGRADLAANEQKQIEEFNAAGGMGGMGGLGGMPLNLGM